MRSCSILFRMLSLCCGRSKPLTRRRPGGNPEPTQVWEPTRISRSRGITIITAIAITTIITITGGGIIIITIITAIATTIITIITAIATTIITTTTITAANRGTARKRHALVGFEEEPTNATLRIVRRG